jgi:hypothetical protein
VACHAASRADSGVACTRIESPSLVRRAAPLSEPLGALELSKVGLCRQPDSVFTRYCLTVSSPRVMMLRLRVSVSAAACRGAAAHAVAPKRASGALARAGRAGPVGARAPRPESPAPGAVAAREERKERAPCAPAPWRRASLGMSRLSLARFSSVAAARKAGAAAKKKKDAAWMTWEGETHRDAVRARAHRGQARAAHGHREERGRRGARHERPRRHAAAHHDSTA